MGHLASWTPSAAQPIESTEMNAIPAVNQQSAFGINELTTQLVRNSIYFFFTSVTIRYFGEYIAI